MNPEKLKKLQAQVAQVRIGGKGTVRRKKKVVHVAAGADEKKLQSSLKQINVNQVPGIEEANIIKNDGTVIHFNNPKIQTSMPCNTFVLSGHAEEKQITDMLPGILTHLGRDNVDQLQRLLLSNFGKGDDLEEDVPTLVGNFDDVAQDHACEHSHNM